MSELNFDSVTPDDLRTIAKMQRIVGDINESNGWTVGAQLRDRLAAMERMGDKLGSPAPSLDDLRQRVVEHQIATLALIVTEASEAIEELRDGNAVTRVYYSHSNVSPFDESVRVNPDGTRRKPEGVPSELADVIIRVLDFANTWEINLGSAIVDKLLYNATREHRHGGKTL